MFVPRSSQESVPTNGSSATHGFSAALRQYLQWHSIEGHSPRTVQGYAEKLGNLERYLQREAPEALADLRCLTRAHIMGWLLALQATCQPPTIRSRYGAAKAFLNWCEDWEILPEGASPMRRIKAPKVPQTRKQTPTADDLNRILALCPPATLIGARRRAMVLVLATTGMRRAELAALRREDVDLEHGLIRIRWGKGQRERRVPLHREAMRALHRYGMHRHDQDHALWVTGAGVPLGYWGVGQEIRRLMDKAGLKGEWPDLCHAWRRRFAEQSSRQGMGRWEATTVGGWSDPKMLDFYARGLAAEERAAEEYRRFDPFK